MKTRTNEEYILRCNKCIAEFKCICAKGAPCTKCKSYKYIGNNQICFNRFYAGINFIIAIYYDKFKV